MLQKVQQQALCLVPGTVSTETNQRRVHREVRLQLCPQTSTDQSHRSIGETEPTTCVCVCVFTHKEDWLLVTINHALSCCLHVRLSYKAWLHILSVTFVDMLLATRSRPQIHIAYNLVHCVWEFDGRSKLEYALWTGTMFQCIIIDFSLLNYNCLFMNMYILRQFYFSLSVASQNFLGPWPVYAGLGGLSWSSRYMNEFVPSAARTVKIRKKRKRKEKNKSEWSDCRPLNTLDIILIRNLPWAQRFQICAWLNGFTHHDPGGCTMILRNLTNFHIYQKHFEISGCHASSWKSSMCLNLCKYSRAWRIVIAGSMRRIRKCDGQPRTGCSLFEMLTA